MKPKQPSKIQLDFEKRQRDRALSKLSSVAMQCRERGVTLTTPDGGTTFEFRGTVAANYWTATFVLWIDWKPVVKCKVANLEEVFRVLVPYIRGRRERRPAIYRREQRHRNTCICPLCHEIATYSPTSKHHYKKDRGGCWDCMRCHVWANCDKFGKPMGELATKKTHNLRYNARKAIETLQRWQKKQGGYSIARSYGELATALGLVPERTVVSLMSDGDLLRTIQHCDRTSAAYQIRAGQGQQQKKKKPAAKQTPIPSRTPSVAPRQSQLKK